MIFMPVFAKDIFHGTPYTLGFLIGASGLGAFVGAIYLASRQGIKGLGRIMAGASALFGVGLMAFALSKILWLSWGCMVLVGFGMMIQFAASNTILQTIVDDTKRGRVMSLYTVAFMGMTPIGSFIGGFLAHRLGVSTTIFMGGLICVLASISFARNLPQLRQAIKHQREQKAMQAPDPASY
jgi:MFS family permease